MPRLHVYKDADLVQTFLLSDASFIAVTAYQNEMVMDILIKINSKNYLSLYILFFSKLKMVKLKIKHNPFAKGHSKKR